jgi:multidrug efflux system membrane fusion protein
MNDDPSSLPTNPGPGQRGAVRPGVIIGVVVLVLAAGAGAWYLRRPAAAESADASPQAHTDGAAKDASGNGGGAGAGGSGKGSRRGGRGGSDTVPVGVEAVATRDIRVTRNALGTVTPQVTVTVQAQVSGQLTQVAFVEGQDVHKGDFLAEIDPRPYQAAVDQAQGQLVKDQATLDEARMDLVRYQELIEKKSIARQQAEDQKWVVVQDEGAVKIDQAQLATAQINLGFCHIVSPTDGRIGLRLVDPGNFIQTGSSSSSLAVITRMQPMTVVFALPEDDVPAVLAHQHAGARLQVQAFDRSGLHLLDTGSLLAIDSQINTSTGTVNLKALFPNAKAALFPNQFVNVVLRIDELTGTLAMPTAAVQRGTNGTFVYVVKPDNKVAIAPVKLGPADGGYVAVSSGLAAGDRVVIDGADKLRDGMTVTVPDAGAPAANRPAARVPPASVPAAG